MNNKNFMSSDDIRHEFSMAMSAMYQVVISIVVTYRYKGLRVQVKLTQGNMQSLICLSQGQKLVSQVIAIKRSTIYYLALLNTASSTI